MGSELLSNVIILILLFTQFRELKFRKIDLFPAIVFPLILFPFYLYSGNEYLLRFIIYIPRFLLILVVFEKFLLNTSYEFLRRILQRVFVIHCVIILLCAVYPPLNVFFNIILAKPFVSEFRISGLFSGYDFISFFTVLYLYGEYRCNDYKFNVYGYFQLFLGFSATLVTGRFGIVLYLVFFSIIFFRKVTLAKIASLFISGFVLMMLFYDRILLFYNTFLLLRDTLQLDDPGNSKLSLEDYGSEKPDGMYQLSPLTLYEEATKPFHDISSYLLPNVIPTVVDSGPSFVILNIGFILFVLLYIYYFRLIYRSITGVTFLTALIFIMDIKFRIILVMMPTIWIILNLERIKKQENI
ncbi:hypothetical protein DNC80_09380 [Flavobacterium sp. SOK18b]|nr:hypothetical protein [Flavobacterium sp. SOK18b]